MQAYRIGSRAHPLLDGGGAAASDSARWNSRGKYVIYAAEHYATALLEKAAQLNSLVLPRTLVYVRIDLPDEATIEEVKVDDVADWDADSRTASQRFGDQWYDDQRSLVLIVPSLVAPGLERNVVINQRHPGFRRVRGSRATPLICQPNLVLRA